MRVVVGLTGGICTGKTTALKIFKELGAKAVSCDKIARAALRKNSGPYKEIVKYFGKSVLKKDGSIDRAKLAKIVFSSKRKREKLERIVHPYVFEKLSGIFSKHKSGVLVVEVPLLFETGFDKNVDFTVVAYCSGKEQFERLKKREPYLSEAEILRKINVQMPLSEKKRRADWLVDSADFKSAFEDIKKILDKIKKSERK